MLQNRDTTTVLLFAALLAPLAAAAVGWKIPAPLDVPLRIHASIAGLLAGLLFFAQQRDAHSVAMRSTIVAIRTAGMAFIGAAILAHRSNAFYTSGAMMDGMALLLLIHLAQRLLRRRCLSSAAAVRLADDLTGLTGLAIVGSWLLIVFERRHIVGPLLLLAGIMQAVAAIVLLPGAMASFGWLAGRGRTRGPVDTHARSLSRHVHRFGSALLVSGTLLMLLGATALRWPDESLLQTKSIAAILLGLLGSCQLALALRVRHESPGWLVALAAGAASLAMALMTVIVSLPSLRATDVLLTVWLLSFAALMAAGALALWPMPRTRTLLLVWSGANVILAGLALLTHPPVAAVLYAGAAYTVAVGASQLAAGVWMRWFAEPWFAPTTQSGWRPPLPDTHAQPSRRPAAQLTCSCSDSAPSR